MLKGTNLKYANSYNLRIVLEAIRLHGPLSRMEISKSTHLTAQTVTNIAKKLIKAGLIYESSRKQSGRGAPSIMLRANPESAYSVGVDFDKDHLVCLLVDLNGNISHKVRVDVDYPTPDHAMELITESIQDLIDQSGIDRNKIWGIGMGVPGPMAKVENGERLNAINPQFYPGWGKVPIVKIFEEQLNIPVYIENNAAAAAIGERWYGDGKHIDSFFYIFFGAGLGGGLILNGQLYPGFEGNAGELGYMPIFRAISGHELVDDSPHLGLYFDLSLLYKELKKQGYYVKTPAELEKLFQEREETVLRWLEKGAEELAYAILAIEFLIDPGTIFFGGRLPGVMINEIINILKEQIPRHRIKNFKEMPKLKIAKAGENATALGAAILPLYNTFAPVPNILQKNDTFYKDSILGNKDIMMNLD